MRCLTIDVPWLDFMKMVLNILKRLSSRLQKHLNEKRQETERTHLN